MNVQHRTVAYNLVLDHNLHAFGSDLFLSLEKNACKIAETVALVAIKNHDFEGSDSGGSGHELHEI